MPDVWPPPPTNQPQVEPLPLPKPPPKGGLDSVVASCIGAFCWLLVVIFAIVDSRTGGRIAWLSPVIFLSCLCGFFFSSTGFIYGLLSWKTRFGRVGLGINAGLITITRVVVFMALRA